MSGMASTESLARSGARDRVTTLFQQGMALYRGSRYGACGEAFRHAVDAADAVGEETMCTESRFWWGAGLHGAGRLREALAVLAPTLADRNAVLDRIPFMAITRYVLVAVDLPIELESIERAIQEIEALEERTGRGRRSRTLLIRARLAQARGRYAEALANAQEALERVPTEAAVFAHSTYLRTIVESSFLAGKPDIAREYVQRWERTQVSNENTSVPLLASARSALFRYEGRIGPAIDWARDAAGRVVLIEDLPARMSAQLALYRALVSSSDVKRARKPVTEVARYRRSETGQLRYLARVAPGDFHLAMARRNLGLRPVDPEWGREIVERPAPGDFGDPGRATAGNRSPSSSRATSAYRPPSPIRPSRATGYVGPKRRELARSHLARARRWYVRAGEVGGEIDRLLRCDVRNREIDGRLGLVDALTS